MLALGVLGTVVLIGGCTTSSADPNPSKRPASSSRPAASDTWGLAALSVVSAREQPSHKAEMGTQILMGHPVQVLLEDSHWCYVRARDGYQAWVEQGTILRCAPSTLEAWTNGNLVVVTALEEVLREAPDALAPAVSDLVMGNWLKPLGSENGWSKVELPDGRSGYVPSGAVQSRREWESARSFTPGNLERTARQFIGRPYLWGGNSPKGLDCSGFTQLVFWWNGVDLPRNASQQAALGRKIPIDRELSQLRAGDLVFFGRRAHGSEPERVTHVGLYLGGKLFIHSSGRVQVNSLDADSSIRDERRISRLLYGRRLLEPAR
jgi:cell wall-associated NlpC family hydrolase